jgi:hypothetical protein
MAGDVADVFRRLCAGRSGEPPHIVVRQLIETAWVQLNGSQPQIGPGRPALASARFKITQALSVIQGLAASRLR